jgi:uncharacterized protein YjbJ (UPF0337 family)
MNRDRIDGAAKQAKGAVKEIVGKAVGNPGLAAEGKAEKLVGKVQNAIGAAEDSLKS